MDELRRYFLYDADGEVVHGTVALYDPWGNWIDPDDTPASLDLIDGDNLTACTVRLSPLSPHDLRHPCTSPCPSCA